MTSEQFATAMQKIAEEHENDPEAAHSEMDELICKQLTILGFTEGVKIFEEQVLRKKWYA